MLLLLAATGASPGLEGEGRAHGLELSLQVEGTRRVLTASYASGVPAGDAEVVLSAPPMEGGVAEEGAVWQRGRTDPLGRFIFAPDRPGRWRITVDDGQGHRATVAFSVGDPEPVVTVDSSAPHPEGRPGPGTAGAGAGAGPGLRLWQLATGVSLIAGLTGVAYGLAARR
jgi:hypothetical protein